MNVPQISDVILRSSATCLQINRRVFKMGRKSKELSEDRKQLVVDLIREGHRTCEIVKLLHIPESPIHWSKEEGRTIHWSKEEGQTIHWPKDTKGVIRSRKSKKDGHYIGQKIPKRVIRSRKSKDGQYIGQKIPKG